MRNLLILGAAVFAWLWYKGRSGTAAPDSGATSSISRVSTSLMEDFTDALTRWEQGSATNIRFNNPGNLHPGNYEGQVGTGYTKTGEPLAIFNDVGDGWSALTNYVSRWAQKNPNGDFYDFFHYYVDGPNAPQSSASADNQADFVASYLGVDPLTPVSAVIG